MEGRAQRLLRSPDGDQFAAYISLFTVRELVPSDHRSKLCELVTSRTDGSSTEVTEWLLYYYFKITEWYDVVSPFYHNLREETSRSEK